MMFTMWLENKTDKEYEISLDDLKKKYREYLDSLSIEKVMGTFHFHHVINFVGSPEGLNSYSDDVDEISDLLQEVGNEFRDEHKKEYDNAKANR